MLLLHVHFTPQNAREWVPVSFWPHVSLQSECLPERPSQTLNFTIPKCSFPKTLLKPKREHHFWGLDPWISLWTPKLVQIAPNWSKSSIIYRKSVTHFFQIPGRISWKWTLGLFQSPRCRKSARGFPRSWAESRESEPQGYFKARGAESQPEVSPDSGQNFVKVNPRVISDSVKEEASASRFEVQDRRNKKRINATDT